MYNITNATLVALLDGQPCQSIESLYPDPVDSWSIRSIFAFFYVLVWILGLSGNFLVLYLTLKPNKQNDVTFTVRTVFIGSLAFSDVLIGLFSLPVTAVMIFTRVWPFPSLVCYSVGFVQASGVFISSFTLTMIAIDRYILILHPTASVVTYDRARFMVCLIWLLGYFLASPLAFNAKIESYPGVCGAFCEENWPPNYFLSRRSYGLSVLLLQFGLPVAISCFCYWRISRRLARHIKLRQNQAILPEAERRLVARRRRTNKMMSSMVAFFVVAWLPLNAANLVRDFELEFITQGNTYNVIFASCHLASMTSLVWNPVIYGFYSETFRAAVKSIFEPCCSSFIFSRGSSRSRKTESMPLNRQKASRLSRK